MNPVEIVRNGAPVAAIMIGANASPFDGWLVEELQRYVTRLSGAKLPVISTEDATPMHTVILIGTPSSNPRIHELESSGTLDVGSLKTDGFIIKALSLDGRDTLVLSGAEERAVMYAVYEFIEQLGVSFQFTGDIIPQTKRDITFSGPDIRREPAIPRRGLHMRHFVMPWMGYDDLCLMIDQMAKMKCNYLEFYWYEGGPWVEYSRNGEKRLIGDLYTKESGFTSWRTETRAFSTRDVVIGNQHFDTVRPVAPEFQECDAPEQAHLVARDLLKRVIAHAHKRKIEIWLGAGDCPTVPPNLGRHSRTGAPAGFFGTLIPPGDPAGVEIWSAILESMIETYPEADGYWLWLAEFYFDMTDPNSLAVVKRYDAIRNLVPGKAELAAMGYDQYQRSLDDAVLVNGDLGLIHCGVEVTKRVRERHPQARLGVSMLGRSYLFRAFDQLLPKDIPLQSMEAAICWNRSSRVPMENYGGLDGRETFLVPRLDDDENEFAMQFNLGLYEHDRVLDGSCDFGVNGIAPQTGKTRGLEANARYIADGCWEPGLNARDFYARFAARAFGDAAGKILAEAMCELDETELFLGLNVDTAEHGQCFQGLANFRNYNDSNDVFWMAMFRKQTHPSVGLDLTEFKWRSGEVEFLRTLRYRTKRFDETVSRLNHVLELFGRARPLVPDGSSAELAYLEVKTKAFILHLRGCCALMESMRTYHAAYTAKKAGDLDAMARCFRGSMSFIDDAERLTTETAEMSASLIDHPSEKFILFRYNVRQLLPIREFKKFIHNIANYHDGRPYWEPVDWDLIRPESFGK
jgi:hypothetical protein